MYEIRRRLFCIWEAVPFRHICQGCLHWFAVILSVSQYSRTHLTCVHGCSMQITTIRWWQLRYTTGWPVSASSSSTEQNTRRGNFNILYIHWKNPGWDRCTTIQGGYIRLRSTSHIDSSVKPSKAFKENQHAKPCLMLSPWAHQKKRLIEWFIDGDLIS